MSDGTTDHPAQPAGVGGTGTGAGPGNGGTGAGERGKLIEAFAATGGRVLGIIVLVIGLAAIIDIVVEWRTAEGIQAAGVIIALATLVWAAMIRPGVVFYDRAVVIRNMARDTTIPWHLVDDVEVSPLLTVKAGEASYRSVAIATTGADRRALWKAKANAGAGNATGLSVGGAAPPSPEVKNAPTPANQRPAQHIAARIRSLSQTNRERSVPLGGVTVRWAWPEGAVFLAGVVIAVVATLV